MKIIYIVKKYGVKFCIWLVSLFIAGLLAKWFDPIYTLIIAKSNLYVFYLTSFLFIRIPIYVFLISLFPFWIFSWGYSKFRIRQNKLKIIKASYGANGTFIDITRQLNDSIVNNRLVVLLSNEISGDPVHGVGKSAEITYEFDGVCKTESFSEGSVINLPV